MNESSTIYEEAHVFIAGIRLFRFWEGRIPSLDELSDLTRLSREAVHHLCNRLEKIGAVERIRGAFEDRVCLKSPLEVESLREEDDAPSMDDEVRRWKEQKEEAVQEVEKRFSPGFGKAEKDQRFSELEEKIRQGGREERRSPLDDLFKKGL